MQEEKPKTKLNILQVITCNSWGGQEMQALQLAVELNKRGHKVVVACRKDSPVELNAKKKGLKIKNVNLRASADLCAIFRLIRIIQTQKIDIVHVHPARDYWPAFISTKLLRKKIIVGRHLLSTFHPLTYMMFHFVDRVIAVSEATKENLVKYGKVNPKKIAVIYNGVDTQVFSPDVDHSFLRKELNLNNHEPLIGCIGRMGCKGQKELLHALNKVVKEVPKLKCLFVSDFSYPQELQKDIDALELKEYIFFRGFRNDIPQIIGGLDILVSLPTWEAFGLVFIEAMALAKPVIASKVGGIPEVVQDKTSGILVDPYNIDETSQALIYLIKNKTEAINMGREGRKIAEEKFSLEDMVDRTEDVYWEVLTNKT